MKQIIVIIVLIFSASVYSNIHAQVAPPPVTGDKDLRDTDIKRRSIDMERVERDTKKTNKTTENPKNKTEDKLAAKYEEIKTDYEQIQLSQDAIIKAYQTGEEINYAQIGKSAAEINKSAKRLDSNLFPALNVEVSDAEKKPETETQAAKSMRDLIVDLDNKIGSFATSPMFQNLRQVDAEIAKKAKEELEQIIKLSALLEAATQKMKRP